jgi:hypothetical protein
VITTPQAEEIREAESLLGEVPIRTGAAFVIHGEFDPARLAEAWTLCGDRLSRDSDGRRLFPVEPLRVMSGDPVSNATREALDRAALAGPADAALFSRLHRMVDGGAVWSVFAHHSVMDGVGLVHFMAVVREFYSGDSASWPYSTWEDSRRLAEKMFEHRGKAEARVADLVEDGGRAAPVLVGPQRREPTVPRIARLGQVRPGWRPETGPRVPDLAQSSLAWLCGYTAVLLLATSEERSVQLSVPRAGVSRTSALPLGTFAYTLPLVVRHPEDRTLSEFLDGIAADIRFNRWSQCFRSGSLRLSFGPNVNLFPVDLSAGTDVRGAHWRYSLISSGPVEDIDIMCAFDGDAHDVRAQIGMAGLGAADFRRVESALRAVLEDFAGTDQATPAADVVRRAREHLAPVTRIGRELATGPRRARGISGEAAVRAAVGEVLRARYGPSADPEEFDFFESGGSSLDAVTLAREISDAVGRPLDPATLYYFPTFDELVAATEAGSDGDRAAGWPSAGFFDIDPGAAGARSADERTGVVERLLRQVLAVWTERWGAGSGDPEVGAANPLPGARDGVAGLVATAGDAGRISLEGEWRPGAAIVRLRVRSDRVTTAAEALDVVERAAAASGLSRVVRSAFGEVFAA